MNVQVIELGESRRHPWDRLREAIEEEVDTVLGQDDVLPHDRLLALVLANLGLKSLHSQQSAAGEIQPGLGDLEAILIKLDHSIQILKPSIVRDKPVIIVSNICDQSGYEVVPAVKGGDVSTRCRIPGIP